MNHEAQDPGNRDGDEAGRRQLTVLVRRASRGRAGGAGGDLHETMQRSSTILSLLRTDRWQSTKELYARFCARRPGDLGQRQFQRYLEAVHDEFAVERTCSGRAYLYRLDPDATR